MTNDLNEVIDKLTAFLKNEAKTDTIIGQQFQLGDFKCIPVIGLGMGMGVGGGEGNGPKQTSGKGMGGGAGIGIGPIGFLVNKGDEIQFIPTRPSKGLSAAFEKLPDILEKYLDQKKHEREEPQKAV